MSRRHKNPINPNSEWPRARIAALRRKVFKKMRKFRNSKELAYLEARDKEKAPGLATEGFSSFFHEKEG